MSRDYRLYLLDIIDSCNQVRTYTAGTTFDQFFNDRKTVDAVVQNLEIIGEAVKNVPLELRDLQPHIDWKRAAQFRDKIAHQYFRIDYEVVWSIVNKRIDSIRDAAEKILLTLPPVDDDFN